MIVGLAFDLKPERPSEDAGPEDAAEELDSPETITAISRAIEQAGYQVVHLGGGAAFLRKVLDNPVDIAFNIAEGWGSRSRESHVPSVLEMLGIPYTGSDPLTLAVTQHKAIAKQLVRSARIPTPSWVLVERQEQLTAALVRGLRFPLFVKPAWEESSKGIRYNSRASDFGELIGRVALLVRDYGQPAVVEEFIPGREVTVGVLGNSPPTILATMEVVPRSGLDPDFVYSLEVKRDWRNAVTYRCPAGLDPLALRRLEKAAMKAFAVLGCRDACRMDFRVSQDGTPYFLEANPLPGLSPSHSDLPIMALKSGRSYEWLIAAILNAALGRYPHLQRRGAQSQSVTESAATSTATLPT